jgi:hypothetical protein
MHFLYSEIAFRLHATSRALAARPWQCDCYIGSLLLRLFNILLGVLVFVISELPLTNLFKLQDTHRGSN